MAPPNRQQLSNSSGTLTETIQIVGGVGRLQLLVQAVHPAGGNQCPRVRELVVTDIFGMKSSCKEVLNLALLTGSRRPKECYQTVTIPWNNIECNSNS